MRRIPKPSLSVSNMVLSDMWLSPPPPWMPIQGTRTVQSDNIRLQNNLPQFWDVSVLGESSEGSGLGTVLTLVQFYKFILSVEAVSRTKDLVNNPS
jgi:hypothetical protein